MHIRMRETYYQRGVPEYEAGKVYGPDECPSRLRSRFLRRGFAEEFVPESKGKPTGKAKGGKPEAADSAESKAGDGAKK